MKPHWIVPGGLSLLILVAAFSPAPPPPPLGAEPSQGYPGQIIRISGIPSTAERVGWDVATGTAQAAIPGNNPVAFVQIPRNLSPGSHQVGVSTVDGRFLDQVSVNVLPSPGAWPAPRIEDIGISQIQGVAGGLNIVIAVSVANVDPAATVEVGGAVLTSSLTSAITGDFNASSPTSPGASGPAGYKYPVYHYGLLSALLTGQAYNTTVTVKVTNKDGGSDTKDYRIPAKALLDSDGDGLLDDWEIKGYPAPGGSMIDLKAMGCDPHRKDILVEVDWMKSAKPDPGIFSRIEDAFSKGALILNPDGSRGISLHIDRGQGAPFTGGGTELNDFETMGFCSYRGAPNNVRLADLKSSGFNPARLGVFHYCIFGIATPGGYSGAGEVWGDDFFVTLGMIPNWQTDLNKQVGTFVHELGHNMGLRHGGIDNGAPDEDETRKPNQESLMNYLFQWTGLPVGTPGGNFTYSTGRRFTVDENMLHTDVNADADATDVLVNYDEWGHLELNFRDPHARSDEDSTPCVLDVSSACPCGTVIWQMFVMGDSCRVNKTQLQRLGDGLTIEHGLCYPTGGCGDTLICVPPGTYLASVVCDTNKYYFTGVPGDTIYVPNNIASADSVQVIPGDTARISIIVHR